MEMRQDGEHGEQIAGEMAAGVSEKCRRSREVKRQEPQKRAGSKERDGSHEVLIQQRRLEAENNCRDDSEPRAEAIHVIEEIDRVRNSHNPEHRDGEAEDNVRYE